ncbi:MAG: proline--tRNA ligase [Nitrososphaerales archaeon]
MSSQKRLISKDSNFGTWYDELLSGAALADNRYNVKGFIVIRPDLFFIINSVYKMFEKELVESGHDQVLFPTVIPMSNLRREAEHVKGFEDQVFIVESAGGEKLEEQLALRPTSETAVYPMLSLWIRSHRDLPMRLFQAVTVFRHETKATRPLLRAREFSWIETHDAFASDKEARDQVQGDAEISNKIFDELGIPFLPLQREPNDRFPGAEETFAYDTLLPDGHVLQIATTHLLGHRFSKPFDVGFLDEKGDRLHPYTTCFGPGLSRIAASLIATHGDDYGMALPFSVSRRQIVIIPIPKKGEEEVSIREKSNAIDRQLKENGYRVFTDSSDDRPGGKFYKWEQLGSPIRIEIGQKEVEQNVVTLFRRDLRERETVSDQDIIKRISALSTEIQKTTREKAWAWFNSKLKDVSQRSEISEIAKKGYIIRMQYCGKEECGAEIKKDLGLEVRGKRMDIQEEPSGNCAWCGSRSVRIVYTAKSY